MFSVTQSTCFGSPRDIILVHLDFVLPTQEAANRLNTKMLVQIWTHSTRLFVMFVTMRIKCAIGLNLTSNWIDLNLNKVNSNWDAL